MALDINNKNAYYLFGRYVAVVERSNNKPFSNGSFTTFKTTLQI